MALRPQQVAPELLNKVNKALGITALDQWYYVSHYTAKQVIGSSTLNKFGGNLSSFLKCAYPQHHFDEEKLLSTHNIGKDQKFIEVIIRKLFPHTEIQTKARKAVGIINPLTGAYLEIDFWIPSLKLGIEYQDKHHYEYQWYANETLEEYQKRDGIKRTGMSTMGYTLITIGYWWDRTIESVAATIRKYRPDLLQDYERGTAEPIASEPPSGCISESVIPGVAGIMSPFVPNTEFDPTNWYGTEKHDGIRGIYSPNLNKMFSRTGMELLILPSLLKDIPNMLVEGELIAGRGNYNKTTALSYHTNHDDINWPMFRFILFDIPDTELGTYTQRYSAIARALLIHPLVFSQVAFQVMLIDKTHLKMLVDTIISDSGEGVIARQDSRYEFGRTKEMAKIKVRRDADAQVLRFNEYSCTCKLISGVTCDISVSADFDTSNLNAGDIVSYYHDGYSQSGLPKGGEIYKVRFDTNWENLIGGDKQNSIRSVKEVLGSRSLISRAARYKLGHWNKPTNVRAFFDVFARNSGFDPLVVEHWYQVMGKTILQARGYFLRHYSLPQALKIAYPELKFEVEQFGDCKPAGHWKQTQNVRAFLDEFARTHGFDSLSPDDWYSVRSKALLRAGGYFMRHYTLFQALSSAYPELNFTEERFGDLSKPAGYWKQPSNVRSFFDEFARVAGFDPLVPDNWYSVRVKVLQKAGGFGLLSAHGRLLQNALSCAYPELSFDKRKFRTNARNKIGRWNKSRNVRAFFNNFAQNAGFDPLTPENWYPVRLTDLRNAGGFGLLTTYGRYLNTALTCAYPELKFDQEKFRKMVQLQ